MEQFLAFRVTVVAANEAKDHFLKRNDNGVLERYPAINGQIIVLTKNPTKLFQTLPDSIVKKVEKIEPGYLI